MSSHSACRAIQQVFAYSVNSYSAKIGMDRLEVLYKLIDNTPLHNTPCISERYVMSEEARPSFESLSLIELALRNDNSTQVVASPGYFAVCGEFNSDDGFSNVVRIMHKFLGGNWESLFEPCDGSEWLVGEEGEDCFLDDDLEEEFVAAVRKFLLEEEKY